MFNQGQGETATTESYSQIKALNTNGFSKPLSITKKLQLSNANSQHSTEKYRLALNDM